MSVDFAICSFGKIAFKKIFKGEGRPTIVFLHEGLGSIEQWKDFPDKLCELTGYNGVVFDRIGYGKSGSLPNKRSVGYLEEQAFEHLPELLPHLKIKEDTILFGHSDGGTIALLYASKYKVKAVVTEAAHVFVEKETLEGIEPAIDFFENGKLKQLLTNYHGDKTNEIFYAWANTWRLSEFRNWNIEQLIQTVNCPALIIQGEEDQYGTVAQVDAIVKNVSGKATKLMLPNCKHSPHVEQEEQVLNNTISFLSEID